MLKKYITKSGDTFDSISFFMYGNEKYSSEIMKANPDLIKTIVFDAEIEVKIPEIDLEAESTLPPWKVQ